VIDPLHKAPRGVIFVDVDLYKGDFKCLQPFAYDPGIGAVWSSVNNHRQRFDFIIDHFKKPAVILSHIASLTSTPFFP